MLIWIPAMTQSHPWHDASMCCTVHKVKTQYRQITECFTGLADLLMDIHIYIDCAIQWSIREESR